MADPRPDRTGDTTSTPVWLKMFGIVVLIVVALFVVVQFVVMHLTGGGPGLHGPP